MDETLKEKEYSFRVPALSHDINPIDILGTCFQGQFVLEDILRELSLLLENSGNILEELIGNFVNSIQRTLQVCIDARGGNILYLLYFVFNF